MQRAMALLFYTACACTMMPLNKVVMLHLYRTPFSAVCGQMLGAALLLLFVPHTYCTSWPEVRRLLVLPPIFTMMLATSMLSLRYASLGAIMAIRNTAPLLALPAEYLCIEPQRVNAQTVASLLCVVCGCIGYVYHDLHSTPLGVALAVTNTVFSVVDRLLQRHLLVTTDVSRCSLLFVNNASGGLLLALLATAVHERPPWAFATPEAYLPWTTSVVVGLLLGYSGTLAQSVVSATTHLVVTNINRILVLAVGSYILHEAPTWQSLVAGGVSLVGTVWYSLVT